LHAKVRSQAWSTLVSHTDWGEAQPTTNMDTAALLMRKSLQRRGAGPPGLREGQTHVRAPGGRARARLFPGSLEGPGCAPH
ncbi:MAG: hypothetical protein ACXU86_21160, partial [Archangium sp.]